MELWAIVPELIIGGLCLVLVPLAGFTRDRWRLLPALVAAAGLIVSIVFTLRMLPWQPTEIFGGTYAIDGFGTTFKLIIEIGALISLLLLVSFFGDRPQIPHAPVALLFSTLGAAGVACSLDLGLIVLFLQMLSLASYLLVGVVRSHRPGNEATLKYFIYAAAALAVMAYGLTFLYGLTGSLDLRVIGRHLGSSDPVWVALALGLILVGYGFEVTLVPFHFWAPDVYAGATAPVTGFLSVVPKIGGFAGLLRFLLVAFPEGTAHWPLLIAILAGMTMTLGNLVALRQVRMKRLLAYSSIAQAGYVLIAVAVADRVPDAVAAAGYYLAVYTFMNLGAFAVVSRIERLRGSDQLTEFRGLGRRAPLSAAVLALSLLSLAGIPPLAGFAGKVLLIKVALDGGMVWLTIVAVANMAIALYYYVAVIGQMYLEGASASDLPAAGSAQRVVEAVSVGGIVLLGVFPSFGLEITRNLAQLLR